MSADPSPRDFIPLLAIAIPIIAVAGGLVVGIVRVIGQQRLVELAHRERIAAIERGIDPAKLPPMPRLEEYEGAYGPKSGSPRRRAQGLLIGGLVTLALGISM